MEPDLPPRFRADGLAKRRWSDGRPVGGWTIRSSLSAVVGTVFASIAAAGVFAALALFAGIVWLSWTLRTWRQR